MRYPKVEHERARQETRGQRASREKRKTRAPFPAFLRRGYVVVNVSPAEHHRIGGPIAVHLRVPPHRVNQRHEDGQNRDQPQHRPKVLDVGRESRARSRD